MFSKFHKWTKILVKYWKQKMFSEGYIKMWLIDLLLHGSAYLADA